jgi:NAD(P)H-hydrate epimerase
MSDSLHLSREHSRNVDEVAIHELHLPGIVLMENAGRGVVDLMEQQGISGKVLIACGKGNNAGDGFVMARHLLLRGYDLELWMWSDASQLQGDALANFAILEQAGVAVNHCRSEQDLLRFSKSIAQADWIVDALLGTGAIGAPRPPFDQVISELNRANARKLAIDIPSGMDCDSGQSSEPTFRADITCTFFSRKKGFGQGKSSDYLGDVYVMDIGVPQGWVLPRLVK